MKSRRRAPRREAAEGGGRLRAGALLDVRVERILPGGVGLAHAEGQTLFVSLAAPGDLARVRVDSTRGRAAFASIVEVLEPSPARTEPPCPYFGRCGGCDFQQLTYEAQLAAKAEIIRDCLRRVAHTEPPDEIEVVPSPEVWRYRSRARWQHDPVRRHLGYYERGSHRVCDVAECPVAAPPVAERLAHLREMMSEGSLPQAPEFEAVAGDEGVALEPTVAPGDEREQVRRIGGENYRFDAGCFFQINHALLEPLVEEGLRGTVEGGDIALDLYSGVGLFTLPLARRFKQVIAVEGNPASAEYARRNLSDSLLTNARVETSAVGDWLAHDSTKPVRADFILLDPPRAGAEPEAIRAIIALKPAHISYVSCDPATLARDLRLLLDAGYSLATLRAFDMFPQTHHVETVVHLFKS
ncbi:MAG: rRNA (uracil1939-C5)-methyltransferase [Acidobacteriota bacterium]|jgi:23S rRNA (uracil1939-C5)-methyltransferase|nr:rRNA (uracil1939-C5)-methyltransferase [Acidobacteriota bacterium]